MREESSHRAGEGFFREECFPIHRDPKRLPQGSAVVGLIGWLGSFQKVDRKPDRKMPRFLSQSLLGMNIA